MTKEQEAIEILNKFKNNEMQRDKLEISRYGGWKIGDIYKHLELNPAIETVLSMIEKKDKQIDLMAEFISKQDVEEEICIKNKTNPDWCNEDYTNCKDCIKQYYERKSKE